ncbi:MAG: DUF475 domain-containing protein [Chitinophagia bacterium]|nr:DUF475 domain-containing protein [Chitinophagia bacterium]
MEHIKNLQELISDITSNPGPSSAIVANLIIIESLMSVDNAAVLATMVLDLPEKDRDKALKYGMLGAYLFRGLAMLFAGVLIRFWFLKPLGGLYLLYLVYEWWHGKQTKTKEDDFEDKKANWLYRATVGTFGNFWATVALIELMDMAFSIDNVFAAVAFSDNILLVCLGVFIGILAMRFVAQTFVKLMERYPFLETAAFMVIGLLGVKLALSLVSHFMPESAFGKFLESETTDVVTSVLTVCIFGIPILTSLLFNVPKRKK